MNRQQKIFVMLMAACMAYKMGIDLETIQSVIRSFKGVEHRIEYVNTIKVGVSIMIRKLQTHMQLVQLYPLLIRM